MGYNSDYYTEEEDKYRVEELKSYEREDIMGKRIKDVEIQAEKFHEIAKIRKELAKKKELE